MSSANYTYDAIGNLITDASENISSIEWTPRGKIQKVTRGSGTKSDLEFVYDAMGNRIVKIVKSRAGGSPVKQHDWIYTYYVRDALGNVMATYTRSFDDNHDGSFDDHINLKDHSIYGSSRIGLVDGAHVSAETGTFTATEPTIEFVSPSYSVTPSPSNCSSTCKYSRTLTRKTYELSNHLGNVLVTISDKRIPYDNVASNSVVDYYKADPTSYTDYYAFGNPEPNRNGNSSSYRYGFNGKENDHETVSTGEGTQDYGLRIYNPALGKFLSVDPLTAKFPELTPYQFASNCPIEAIDLDGAERWGKKEQDEAQKAYEKEMNPYETDYFGKQTQSTTTASSSTGGTNNTGTNTATTNTTTTTGGTQDKSILDKGAKWLSDNGGYLSNPTNDFVVGSFGQKAGELVKRGRDISKAPYELATKIVRSKMFISTSAGIVRLSPKILGVASKSLKIGGGVIGVVGMAKSISDYQSGAIDYTGQKMSGLELTGDLTVGVIGFTPIGPAVSLCYTIVKPFGKAAIPAMKEYNEKHPIDEPGNLIYHICFGIGTPIYTSKGMIPIEEIHQGDSVFSYNLQTDRIILSCVKNTLIRNTDEYYEIKTMNQTIIVTQEHPFYVLGKGWVKVKDLKVGDDFKTDCSTPEKITSLELRKGTINVYNLEVDGNHNYFVTNGKILVHNKTIRNEMKKNPSNNNSLKRSSSGLPNRLVTKKRDRNLVLPNKYTRRKQKQ